MSKQDVKAGRAYVELFLKNSLTKGLAAASKQLVAWGNGAMGIGKSIMGVGAAVAGAGALMVMAFAAPIKAAGDLMETTSKFGSVFGEQTGEATAWLNDFTKAVGRGKKEAMDGMAAFGAFFQGMGKGGEEATEMSKRMTRLAIDFGSFHNVSDPESIQRFISALSGSSQVLDMFGINIKQSALDMKLLEMGFPSVAKGADETQKVLARMAIIEESMGRQGAVGDAIRTAGSFSNQMKKLSGTIMDTAAAIGNALLPVVTPMITKASSLTETFAEWAKGNTEVIRTVAKIALAVTGAGAAIAAIGAVVFGTGAMFASVGAVLGGVATALAVVLSPLGLVATALVGGAVAWFKYADNGKKAVTELKSMFGGLLGTFKETWGGITAALAGGDLKLAAQIAFAGMKVAFFDAIDSIQTALKPAIDTIVGAWDIVSTMWTFAADGVKAAWGTIKSFFGDSLGTMGGDFSGFAEGLVNAFTAAARAVVEVWQAATASLAKMFLKSKLLTGTDVEKVNANNKLKHLEATQLTMQRLAGNEQLLAKAKSGEPFNFEDFRQDVGNDFARKFDAGGMGQADVVAKLEEMVANEKNSLESLKKHNPDLLADANEYIDTTITESAERFKRALDGLDQRAKDRAEDGAMPDELPTAAENARAQLADLMAKAEAAKAARQKQEEDAKKKGVAVGAAAENAVAGATKAGSQFGSFSGAALGLVGAGGVQQRLLAEQRKRREEAAKQAAEHKKAVEVLQRLTRDNQLEIVG